jgi:hypothetical protein
MRPLTADRPNMLSAAPPNGGRNKALRNSIQPPQPASSDAVPLSSVENLGHIGISYGNNMLLLLLLASKTRTSRH